MRQLVAAIVWLVAGQTVAWAQATTLPLCRDLSVTISVATPRVVVGQRPRFDVSIYNMSPAPGLCWTFEMGAVRTSSVPTSSWC
jgi:hypothetical protein